MKNLLTLVVLFFAFTAVTFATTQKDTIKFSGSVDAYFRSNLNGGNSPSSGVSLAPATSFANLPGFALGMVNLVTEYESGKVGAVADLVVGPRGAEAVFGSPAPLNLVNQLYAYYNVTDDLTFTLGNFNTFLGYEVISPASNFNYSTSYMFSYGPFSHTGLKADFGLGKGFTGMLGVFNPTDATDFNPSFDFVYGAQLGYEKGDFGGWLNFIYDDANEFTQIDLTATYQATDELFLGLNASTASDNFAGVAGYIQYALSESLTAGVRGELFMDEGIGVVGVDESIFDVTVSLNYKVGNLTIIPEVRLDALSTEGFVVDMAETTPELSKQLSSFVLAAVYGF